MIEFHVLTPRGPELVMQVVDGRPVIPAPPPSSKAATGQASYEIDHFIEVEKLA